MAYSDESLIADLKAVLKERKVSLRALSKDIGVPYRTMQNYFSNTTRLPAIILISILEYVGEDISYLRTKKHLLAHHVLYDALWHVFGGVLDKISIDELGNNMEFSNDEMYLEAHRNRIEIASELSIRVSRAYDMYLTDKFAPASRLTIDEIESRRSPIPDSSEEDA